MLYLYDGLNYIRRRLDKDPMGRALRNMTTEMISTQPKDIHVWCFEGRSHLSKRRAIYPLYKTRPSQPPDGFFSLVDLLRQSLKHTNAIQIDVPGFEADDVIAHLTCQHAGKTDIRIISTDRDLNQLLVLPRVTSFATNLEGVLNRDVRLYKTFRGDTSDMIPGLSGFGHKSWLKCDKGLLCKALHKTLGDFQAYTDAGLGKAQAKNAVSDHYLLQSFWKIVGFFPLDVNVEDHMKPGKPDFKQADAILREFNH